MRTHIWELFQIRISQSSKVTTSLRYQLFVNAALVYAFVSHSDAALLRRSSKGRSLEKAEILHTTTSSYLESTYLETDVRAGMQNQEYCLAAFFSLLTLLPSGERQQTTQQQSSRHDCSLYTYNNLNRLVCIIT